MKRIEIEIEGKKYPCYQTMGAMLRFKEETGREAASITDGALSDMVIFLWCCIRSACRREGIAFDYKVEDFADRMTFEDVVAWAAAIGNSAADDAAGDEKKTESLPQ